MTDQKEQFDFNAMDYLGLLWRRRKLFLLPFILAAALTLGVGSLLPKGYESKTITKVIDRSYLDKLYVGMNVAPPPTIELDIAKFEIKNKSHIEEVLDGENMLVDCRSELERQEAIDRVRDKIEVDVITPKMGGDKLLNISFTWSKAFIAQNLLNRITQNYISRLRVKYQKKIQETRDKAMEDERRSSVNYDEAQDKLQEFEEQHFEALMGGDKPAIEGEIEELKKSEEEAVDRIRQLEAQIRQNTSTLNTLEPEIVKHEREKNPSWEALNEEVQGLKSKWDELAVNRNSDHPAVIKIRGLYEKRKAELDQTKRYLKDQEIRKPNPKYDEVSIALQDAEAELELKQITKLEISEKLAFKREKVKSLPMLRGQHKKLLDSVDRANDQLKEFTKKLLQASTTWFRVTNTLDDLFIPIERASKPLKHSTPPAALILLIALALGLAAGVGTVFAVEVGRKTFHTPEDVSAMLSWPVLGVVHTILSKYEQKQRARKRAAAVVATLILAIGVSTVVYIYNRNPDLLPNFLVDSVQKFKDLV